MTIFLSTIFTGVLIGILEKYDAHFATTLICFCIFFSIGIVHSIIGPILSAYTISSLIWSIYLGHTPLPSALSLWPSFFDFYSINNKHIEYIIMIASTLFGLSDYVQDIPNKLSEYC